MLTLRRLSIAIALATLLLSAPALRGQTSQPDNSTAARAARFFSYREWINAGALYTMLLGDHPDNTLYCARAIVSAGMLGDTLQQTTLTNNALDAHIAVDSLLTAVERTSFSVGQTSLYEEYLLHTKSTSPWLARVIDGYLMRYYTYRRNPEGMIAYSKIMLSGNPESLPFLYTLAQGYLLSGQTDDAVGTYLKIVEIDPQSIDALLYLANYYDLIHDNSRALFFFEQASAINRTPFIDRAIARLRR